VGLGIRGRSWVGLGICKVGGVGSGSDSSLWISCSAVRTISINLIFQNINRNSFQYLIDKNIKLNNSVLAKQVSSFFPF